MTLGVDYSDSHPTPDGLVQAGRLFACRYLGAGSADKRLTLDEALALNRAGVKIVSLVEGAERDPLSGYPTGKDHALAASRDAIAIGMAPHRPYYFAVDWDLQDADWPAVSQYLTGAASVVGWANVGLYGGLRAMQLASETTALRWLFQTYAWSNGIWHPAATMRQTHNNVDLAGGNVDLCQAMTVDYGQWSIVDSQIERDDMPHFLNDRAGATQWMADSNFERVWAFDNEPLWRRVINAAGGPATVPVDAADVAAGVYGEPMGLYRVPRQAPSVVVDQAAIQASASTGAAAGVQGAIGDGSGVAASIASAVGTQLGNLAGTASLTLHYSGQGTGAQPG